MWNEVIFIGKQPTLTELLEILDDALCHRFEFKVENHKIYYREIVD